MQRVFGLPAGALAIALTVTLALSAVAIVVLAVRNPVFFKMGIRNIPRRPARTALIVVGLMLATAIISAALLTGDTMTKAVRSSVLTTMGSTDVAVVGGAQATTGGGTEEVRSSQPYFDGASALDVVGRTAAGLPVDGFMAAIIEPVAGQHAAAGRTEPRLSLFAPDPASTGAFGFDDVTGLARGEVLLNDRAASELDAAAGDEVQVLVGTRIATLTVAGTGRYDGAGTDGAAVIMPLGDAQELLGRAGQVNHVLVSNTGGLTSGVEHSDVVVAALEEAVAPLGLTAEPSKQDGLAQADAAGDVFVQLFTTFGSFSMAAGILLIFLIFVMLATERRAEMGMARAVGTQRRHLVQSFLFEGAVYDVIAAAVGAALGVGVSFVMVQVVGRAFATEGLELTYSLSARSLLIGYTIGILLTLVVVTASAWRVSRLNIVSAIRDLNEPARGGRRRATWLVLAVMLPLGILLAVSGATSRIYLPWMIGLSLVILSSVTLIRLAGGSVRLAFTIGGALVVVQWLLPLGFFDRFFGEMAMDFTIWVVGGLLLVVAATWVTTFNADVLLRGLSWLTSPIARLRPVVKMAVAYPLQSRFRTGVTMAMFMLVVFTLVSGTVIPSAFTRAMNDVETFGGGYDIRVSTAPAAAVADLRSELPDELASEIERTGGQSFVPVLASQDGTDRPPAPYALRGLDDDFLAATTYRFSALARGYDSAQAVWAALASDTGLAVVDGFIAPRRQNWNITVMPEFQLSGFYVDEGTFDPVPITVEDPLSGEVLHLTVIGVLTDDTPWAMAGVTVSQAALGAFGGRATPTVHHLGVVPGADAEAVADGVEAALLARGGEARTYAALLDEVVGANLLFLRLIQGFMALGLVVGVAALGVVSARAVVERRQQLGMLRAIGFQPAMIRRTLLLESSIVSMTSITIGALLGLAISYNVIADAREQQGWSEVTFAVPWLNLFIVFAAVFVAALATTYLPARRASRIYPAEALRYQ
jgi:putative ABC transport system permease protein